VPELRLNERLQLTSAAEKSAVRQSGGDQALILTSAEVYDEMAALGMSLLSGDPATVAEEAAFAYQDIESVMAASSSLVRPVRRLTPLGVVKG
jgi:RNA-splicing ligase RtcB